MCICPVFPALLTEETVFSLLYTLVFVRLPNHACVLSHFSLVQLFVTPWTVTHQAPLSMGILQARILEWVAMPSSRGSSQPRDWTSISSISCIGDALAGGFFTTSATWEALIAHRWVGLNLSSLFFHWSMCLLFVPVSCGFDYCIFVV